MTLGMRDSEDWDTFFCFSLNEHYMFVKYKLLRSNPHQLFLTLIVLSHTEHIL